MSNVIEICNVALSRIGSGSIQSLTEATREARACNVHYTMARDAVLRDHDWQFARKQDTLALLTETWDGWDYVYQYPADCIAARYIYNSASKDPKDAIPFEIGISFSGNNRVVLTDEASAVLIYTMKVVNPVVFDSLFVDALAWRMAGELAVPLKASQALGESLGKKYLQSLALAKGTGANEASAEVFVSSSFADARA